MIDQRPISGSFSLKEDSNREYILVHSILAKKLREEIQHKWVAVGRQILVECRQRVENPGLSELQVSIIY